VSRPAGDETHTRNFLLLAAQMVVIRIGWIFKTESVIIPAFLDSIAGPGWMRGLLPVLNRTGQSIPAFLLAGALRRTPLKKRALAASSFLMAVPFLGLGLLLAPGLGLGLQGGPSASWPGVFLALYFVFWCFSGLNMVVSGTLQGKLVRPQARGRLIAASVFGSVVPAVGFAWWLLPGWLEAPVPGYDRIFAFTGVCFVIAALVARFLDEAPDEGFVPRERLGEQLRSAWQILKGDRNYRRAVIVASLFSSSIMVFPHYQALARVRLGLGGSDLMVWVVVQNVSMGVASLLVGPLADRFGNRLALRVLTFAAAGIPLLALWLTTLEAELARSLFLWVFVGIGLIPIGFRVITNYLLEIAPPEDHPRYLSLNQLCTAAAFLASPFFGLLIDLTSFELVFGIEVALMLAGAFLTFGLSEPRELAR
jgi:MFS family permease